MQRGTGIVVGYDGTGRARSALAWGAREAARRGLPLQIIHVVPYAVAPPRGAARALESSVPVPNLVLADGIRLARILLGGDPDRVSGVSPAGHPVGVLAEASRDAALVVVGQRSQDGPVSSAVGSTSTVLAERAHCPVVVARGATGQERTGLPVVVGVTGAASSLAALDFAARTAEGRGVPLTIVSSWSLPPAREWHRASHGLDTVAQWARALSARASAAADASECHVHQHYPTVPTQTRVEQLEAATALVRASRRAGLVVVGHPTTGDTAATSVPSGRAGRVAHIVLGRAACPVVVVRGSAGTTEESSVATAQTK
jgi:nucleotide-binding universal stress UspA family protein